MSLFAGKHNDSKLREFTNGVRSLGLRSNQEDVDLVFIVGRDLTMESRLRTLAGYADNPCGGNATILVRR